MDDHSAFDLHIFLPRKIVPVACSRRQICFSIVATDPSGFCDSLADKDEHEPDVAAPNKINITIWRII